MKTTRGNDLFAKNGRIREDPRMVHDMNLYEVKQPSGSRGEWDRDKLVATMPGDKTFRPIEAGGQPVLKKG